MRRVLFGLLSVLGFGVAAYALTYFVGLPFRFPGPSAIHFFQVRHLLYAHVLGGAVAFLTGPWQFAGGLRVRRPRLHRWLGYIYFFAVILGGAFGIALAPITMGGLGTHLGFGFLAVIWMFVTLQAVRFARMGKYVLHQQWMTRSFALTLAAVTLRVYLPILQTQMLFLTAYAIVSWLCWVPNLLVAEWLIAGNRLQRVEVPVR